MQAPMPSRAHRLRPGQAVACGLISFLTLGQLPFCEPRCRTQWLDTDGDGKVDTCSDNLPPPGFECLPRSDFSGTWHSVYSCTGTFGTFSGEFDLTIVQNGEVAYYQDGRTRFSGLVCRNVWSFSATTQIDVGTETESGTITLNGDGTATRSSHYSNPVNAGDCTDTLTRLP